MNKKVALSVLSTAVVASMAASAYAAPKAGIYVGGEIKKYYSTTTLTKLSKEAKAQYGKELRAAGNDNLVFVHINGKGAFFSEILNHPNGSKGAFEQPLKKSDFVDLYKVVKPDGTSTETEDAKSKVEDDTTGDLKVESVSAINKTKVEVKFTKAFDSINAANFSIEGAVVKSATPNADKKGAILEVSGLDYKKKYTLVAKDILVDGKKVPDSTKDFTTPAVTDLWNLQVSPKDAVLKADGADNTVVTFSLIDKVTGQVDKNADNVVLDLNTTQGNLAQKRLTIQDGTGSVVLKSEFSNTELTAKIDAQIIEASGDYKDLIGQVVGTATVKFANGTGVIEDIKLVSAESNQADRVTLFFDKEVSLSTLVKTNDKGELLYNVTGMVGDLTKSQIPKNTKPEDISHALRAGAVQISQVGNTDIKVQGIKPLANPKAVEVILAKKYVNGKPDPEAVLLTDNKQVDVKVTTTNSINKETKSDDDFKLTDARDAEATSVTVEGLNSLKVKFSEALNQATFTIDGQFDKSKFDVIYGEFNPATLEDNRDMVTLKLNKQYKEHPDAVAGFFMPGKHSLQISSIEDFAAVTDTANVGTTQTLGFEITADSSAPTAETKVESPEQIRVTFNKTLADELTANDFVLQYYDADTKQYVPVAKAGDFKILPELTVDTISSTEYVLELTEDWTKIFQTKTSKVNYYNHKFRIHIAEGKATNAANGVKNKEINLDLNYSGSPLNTPDTKSPTIQSIEKVAGTASKFVVTVDKPVKLNNGSFAEKKSDKNDTRNEDQLQVLPETSVQFFGKDKNGVTKTVDGVVEGYADDNGADTKFFVNADLQTLVDNEEYNENWELAVKSLSDDVGNTVNTKNTAFKVTKSPAGDSPFYIVKAEGTLNGAAPDTLTITFSEGVQYRGGAFDATNIGQYTVNAELMPVGTNIVVKDLDGNAKNGFETVVITLPDNTLQKTGNNVVTVNRHLESFDNTKLTRDFEVAVTILDVDDAAAIGVDNKIGSLPAVSALTLAHKAAVQEARKAFDALTPAQQAKVTRAAELTAAEQKIAQLEADQAAAQALAAINSGTYTATDLTTAGVTGVDAAKFANYKAAIDAAKATKGSNLTLAEVQAEVTKVNTPALDTTAIDTAVSAANAAKVVVSTDGSDVDPADKWVTQAVQDALVNAIADA
ncbi:sugar-binding domain protein, partial [Brevibacillus brevis]|uniref:sugar-binding domain protein n=1 Tax=Brevibacillus brevis TaxID=1393 RepID=UPI001F2C9FEF